MTSLTYFPVSGDYRNVSDPDLSGRTNDPEVEIISGLVTFTARLPDGFVAYIDDFEVVPTINEVQRVNLAHATGGTFTLTYAGQTTGNVAYNATANTVKLALEALSNIGVGDVAVTGDAGGPYLVSFTGTLSGTNVGVMIANGDNLDGTAPAIVITTVRAGVAAVNEVQTLTISGSPTGGSFLITYAGQTTGPLPYNATAAAVQAALASLANIGTGNVSVTGSNGGPYAIAFIGALGGRNIWQMTASPTGLSGGTPNAVVTTTTPGLRAYNEIQNIKLGSASAGTFTLTFNGQTTIAIPYNASVAVVRNALENLSNLAPADITVAGISGNYTIAFQGSMAGTNVPQFTANTAGLSGLTSTVGVFTLESGSPGTQRPTAIAIPPRHGRIWEGRLSTINVEDTAGVDLVSNIPALGLLGRGFDELIYDVEFSQIVYAEGSRTISNFAFVAPVGGTEVVLTDSDLERLPYLGRVQAALISEVRLTTQTVISTITAASTIPSTPNRWFVVLCGVGSAPTLPTAVGYQSMVTLKNTTGSNITILTTSGQTIEGSASPYVLPAGVSLTLVSYNAAWRII